MSSEKFCKIIQGIKIDKNLIAQKKVNKKAAYNKIFEKHDKNSLNFLNMF